MVSFLSLLACITAGLIVIAILERTNERTRSSERLPGKVRNDNTKDTTAEEPRKTLSTYIII